MNVFRRLGRRACCSAKAAWGSWAAEVLWSVPGDCLSDGGVVRVVRVFWRLIQIVRAYFAIEFIVNLALHGVAGRATAASQPARN